MKDIKLSDLIETCKEMENNNPSNPCRFCEYKKDFCDMVYKDKRLPRAIDSIGKKVEKKFGDYTFNELYYYCKAQEECDDCKFQLCCNTQFEYFSPSDFSEETLDTNIYINEENKQ